MAFSNAICSPDGFAISEPGLRLAAVGDLVLCGSMSALGTMHRVAQRLLDHGLPAILPPVDDDSWDYATPQTLLSLKRSASLAHLKRVRARRTAAVLAVNLDRHGIHDYIGPNTFAELALAFASGKRLYLWQDIPAQYDDELRAWGAVSLDGDLERLLDIELRPMTNPNQLSLFEDWEPLVMMAHPLLAA
jgi:hypothetical protein